METEDLPWVDIDGDVMSASVKKVSLTIKNSIAYRKATANNKPRQEINFILTAAQLCWTPPYSP
jgi:hypothetical protein